MYINIRIYIYIFMILQYICKKGSEISSCLREIMDAYGCKYVPGHHFLCNCRLASLTWNLLTHALLGPFGSPNHDSFNMSQPDFVSWLPLKLQRDTHLDGFSASVKLQVSLPMPMLLCPWKLSMHHWKTRKEEQIQVLRMSMGIHMQQDHDAMQGASNEHMPPSMQMWIWKANGQITQCGALVIVQEPTDNW